MSIKQSDLNRLWKNLLEFQLNPFELGSILDGTKPKHRTRESLNQFVSNGQRGKNPVTTRQVFEHFLAFDCGYLIGYCAKVATFIMYAATTSDLEREWCKSLIESNSDGGQSDDECQRISKEMTTMGIKLWSSALQKIPPNPELNDGQR